MTPQPATIQVQYVNQPKEANWSHGNVKDSNKQLWSVRKDRLQYFAQGETCEILWEQTGKYPEIIGKGGQLFPAPILQPQPGSAVSQPRNANWPAPPQNKPPLTYEKPAEPPTPPILSNILATAISAGKIQEPSDLVVWAYHVKQAVDNYHHPGGQDASPANQARNPGTQYGGDHPDAPPMTDPNDPGWA